MTRIKIPLTVRFSIFKLEVSNKLWKLRGLPTCPFHGFHAQSWWTGYCRKCGEKPVISPMKDLCSFCGEEKAILQRASPNDDKEIWSLCWECDKFIDWSELNSITRHFCIEETKPFDEWLFARYQVYPKNDDYITIILKKNKG